jgi:pimeloyl-ACP methyl ester carboxylesterase
MSLLLKTIYTLAAIYLIVLALMYFGQRKLLYRADPVRVAPGDVGLKDVVEREIAMPDGVRVVAWIGKAKPGQPTILYFHGNAGSLAVRKPRLERFMAEGWGVFAVTYRGFGGSGGSPTETDVVADGKRVYDALVADGVTPENIIFYGESLGSGVATQVALEKPAAGLILDAPFTSTVDVAAHRYWFMPVSWAMKDRFETRNYIGRVKMPVLVLHGTLDRVTPVRLGREVARLAPEPKRYVEFPNAGHTDMYINGNNALDAVRDFIATVTVTR